MDLSNRELSEEKPNNGSIFPIIPEEEVSFFLQCLLGCATDRKGQSETEVSSVYQS